MQINQAARLLCLIFLTATGYTQTKISTSDSVEEDGKTFRKVDVEASYPGGVGAWKTFLENTTY